MEFYCCCCVCLFFFSLSLSTKALESLWKFYKIYISKETKIKSTQILPQEVSIESFFMHIYIFKIFVTAVFRHNLCMIKFTHLSVCFDKS